MEIDRGSLASQAIYDPSGTSYVFWGGIFPIIERRCGVPRGLALAADSLSAFWRSDTDAELFQLAVCSDMTEPDSGLLFTTTDTSQALPAFHPDSTYRLYLRKQCAFRQDSVWSDWSAPLVIASRTTEGIGEAENNGWTIDINPNPATKQVHVATNFSLTQIEAFDEQGRLVQTLPATGLKATLDVSSWPRGTYLLRIQTPAGPTTKKLLVQ
ncbi:MAG: T9SS type A sorting domain-containing protein [Bacteroidales bacterium]|nr:T9SS type A sorting domain-containing protein [Bacteroidales bacterium]